MKLLKPNYILKIISQVLLVFCLFVLTTSQGKAAQITLDAQNTDGVITSSHPSSFTAVRAGTGTLSIDTSGATSRIGSHNVFGSSTCGVAECGWEYFLSFDTSSIPVGSTINSVTFRMYGTGYSGFPPGLSVYVRDWGSSVTTADWVAGDSISGLTNVANIGSFTTGYQNFISNSNFLTAIVAGGTTRLIVVGQQFRDNITDSNGNGYYASIYTGDNASNKPQIVVDYTPPNTAPSFSSGPSVAYNVDCATCTRTGPNNRWRFLMTASDAEQTGSNQLTYYIHTGPNRTGTLVSSGTFTSGVQISTIFNYNQSGLVQGSNTLYVSVYDGTIYSASNPSFTLYRDDGVPSSSSSISTNPSTVNSTYTVTFTPGDAISTNSNEISYQIRTASGGLGTLLTSGVSTSGSPATTGSITDAALVNGANTRYVRTCDGANNCTDTSFIVTFDQSPTVTTSTASGLTTNSAVLNSTINPNGSSTNLYYLWGTTNQSCSLLPNTLNGPTALTGTSNLSGATTQATLSDLSPNTTYYFCVMATNAYGTNYGSVVSLTTNATPGAYVMMDAGSALGGGATDCQDDPNGAPCPPSSVTVTNPSSQTQNNISWSGTQTGGAVPAATGYDIEWCTGTSCTPPASGTLTNVTSTYTHTGLSASTTYGYRVVAKNANGSGTPSSPTKYATTQAACTNTTVYSDNDLDGYGNNGPTFAHGVTTRATIGSGTSLTINKPADIQNGMFMIAAVEWTGGSNRSVTAPAGWTLISTSNYSTTVGVGVWYKYASSEGNSYAWTFGNSNPAQGFITSFSNIATSNPIRAYTIGNNWGWSVNGYPAINYTAGDMLLQVVGTDLDSSSRTYYTYPVFGDEQINITPINYFSNDGISANYRKYAGNKSNVYGQGSLSNSVNGAQAIIVVAIKPLTQTTQVQCLAGPPSSGWSTNNTDCDDTTSAYYQNNSSAYPDLDSDGVNPTFQQSICSGASLRPGVSASPGTDCAQNGNADDGAKWQMLNGYVDNDNDNYTVGGQIQVCSGSLLPLGYRSSASGQTDCYDGNANAYPGSSYYSEYNRGDGSWDYNCDGQQTKVQVNACTGSTNIFGYYWYGAGCEGPNSYFVGCYGTAPTTPSGSCGQSSGLNVPAVPGYFSDSACTNLVGNQPAGYGNTACY